MQQALRGGKHAQLVRLRCIIDPIGNGIRKSVDLQAARIEGIHATRFKSLFPWMPSSANRRAFFGAMRQWERRFGGGESSPSFSLRENSSSSRSMTGGPRCSSRRLLLE